MDGFVKWERNKVAVRGEKHISKALCFPFYPILNAIGSPIVDYFSLDVEGSELPILRSIPWKKVRIKVKWTHHTLPKRIIEYFLETIKMCR